jgi:hypothetical protein
MCIVVLLLFVWNMVIAPTIQAVENQWHYGDAKVSVFTADVGHGGVSEFLAFDKNGQIAIIEMVGHTVTVYSTGSLIGNDRLSRVITLSVADVNHDGKPDLLIHVEGMSATAVLFNHGNNFSWSEK